jgi:isoleucyl-tRNA synthetase
MSMATIEEAVRQFLLQLWNTYSFYVLYANANHLDLMEVGPSPSDPLDGWVLSRLQETVAVVRERLDDFDATISGREIQRFVDDLSNWYVRRSRRRFWNGDANAFWTLRHCLVTVSQLLAPFCPFIADEIFDNLDGSEPSVHLCDFPAAGPRDEELEQAMAVARETVRLGLAARSQAKRKVRQPLRAAVIVATGRERSAIERLSELVRDELNVRELRFVSEADELGEVEVKPNYRALGPRFGKQMPIVAAAIAGLDPARVAASLRDGGRVAIDIGGSEHTLGADDLLLSMKPLEGYQVEREGSHAVALELEIDGPLRAEGLAREVVHVVQNRRRDAGLDVSDRITLILDGDAELLDAVRVHQGYVTGETLAIGITYADLDGAEPTMIDGRPLKIAIVLA